jgi:hypothetical protein
MTKTRTLYLTIATSMLAVNTSNANASWWDSITQGFNAATQWVGKSATTVYNTVAPVVDHLGNQVVQGLKTGIDGLENFTNTTVAPNLQKAQTWVAQTALPQAQLLANQAGQNIQRYATQAYDYARGAGEGLQTVAAPQPAPVQQPVLSPLAQQVGGVLAGDVASRQYEAEAAAAAAQNQQVAVVPQVVVQTAPAPVAEAVVTQLPPQPAPVIVAAAPPMMGILNKDLTQNVLPQQMPAGKMATAMQGKIAVGKMATAMQGKIAVGQMAKAMTGKAKAAKAAKAGAAA